MKDSQFLERFGQIGRLAGLGLAAVFAAIGVFHVLSTGMLHLLSDAAFETEVIESLQSPDGLSLAEVRMRSGTTVNTVRVHVRPSAGSETEWTVYEARDSSYQPPIRWIEDDTLLVTLPCDRFDFVSNPDDWGESRRSLRVRFNYAEGCLPA